MTAVLLRSSLRSSLQRQYSYRVGATVRLLSIYHYDQFPRTRQTRSAPKTTFEYGSSPSRKTTVPGKNRVAARQENPQDNLVTWDALGSKRTRIDADHELEKSLGIDKDIDEDADIELDAKATTVLTGPRRKPTMTPTAYRWDTSPPGKGKIKKATEIFTKFPPRFVTSAAEFSNMQIGQMPEVTFIGRSNVGKSSLLNALFNRTSMASTSSKPGRTRLMNAFSIAEGRIQLVDMPGYGYASRPEWGTEILAYLRGRRTLRRCFILMDPLHGAKESDRTMMQILGQAGIPYQVVLSKVDRLHGSRSSKGGEVGEGLKKVFEECRQLIEQIGGTSGLGEIIATCGQPETKGSTKSGIDDLRWAILVAAGLTRT